MPNEIGTANSKASTAVSSVHRIPFRGGEEPDPEAAERWQAADEQRQDQAAQKQQDEDA
jgi:hypothetical protein